MKVSVITVSFNKGDEIEETISSVLKQSYKNLEYWIIDGGSTDETKIILDKYRDQLNYISEKDSGIYNAMNKGICNATGDYLLFLNAGDSFINENSITHLIENSNKEDLIYGDLKYYGAETEYVTPSPDILNFDFFTRDTLPHPATLIKRNLFNIVGRYNESIRICADWAFFLDAVAKHDATYKHVKLLVSKFRLGGLSSSGESSNLIKEEKESYLLKNYSFFLAEIHQLDKIRHLRNQLTYSRYVKALSILFPRSLKELIFKKW